MHQNLKSVVVDGPEFVVLSIRVVLDRRFVLGHMISKCDDVYCKDYVLLLR